ncbi:kinase-like protein [Polyplosphaeria fusca]|uniref:Kinase-like protein n=1 Tax=Polyplosphaeria fusca TaxID=682080 RepID=A0A9P4R5M6_9PLEO|nr:kinase-like protein [Polyplosphaeria fusca]
MNAYPFYSRPVQGLTQGSPRAAAMPLKQKLGSLLARVRADKPRIATLHTESTPGLGGNHHSPPVDERNTHTDHEKPVSLPSPPHQSLAAATAFTDRFKDCGLIAEGGNGVVHACEDLRLGKLVAVKTLSRSSTPLPREVLTLQQLGDHPNIVRCFDVLDDPADPWKQKIIFELCEMDLVDYWETQWPEGTDVPEMFLWHVLKQVGAALAHVHGRGVVHGDLKPPNVLLVPEKPWPRLILTDFGAARIDPPTSVPRCHMGTYGWHPPEINVYGPANDMWGLGCVVHWLALGHEPTSNRDLGPQNADEWFANERRHVPAHTPSPECFKQYCLWHAQHFPVPERIDRFTKYASIQRSKLMNYFMMRSLEMRFWSRITAFELNRFMSVLYDFVQGITEMGKEGVLEHFDEGRSETWECIKAVSDSDIFFQIFTACHSWSHYVKNDRLIGLAKPLLDIMDSADFAKAHKLLGRPMIRGPPAIQELETQLGDMLKDVGPAAQDDSNRENL